jgi:hypothetical protein
MRLPDAIIATVTAASTVLSTQKNVKKVLPRRMELVETA